MQFKTVGKRLIMVDCSAGITEGENIFDEVKITLPRKHDNIDNSLLSYRFTEISEDGSKIAVQVLTQESCDEKNVCLTGAITSNFSAITGKVFFMLTGVNDDNVIAKYQSSAFKVSDDLSLSAIPDETAGEQLFNQVQLEVEKAISAAVQAKTYSETPAPAEIYPATAERLGGVLSGIDISVDGSGVVTVNSVNGKTIGKSVPDDAVFTDTVYVLPKASTEILGGVKVDGTTITSDDNGIISAPELMEIKAYLGLTDNDILGLHADFENNIFMRLGAAVGKNAGSDFDSFLMYGGRKRCNVLDNGTITAYYGDDNFAEDGSNGQVMVYQPKFYYKIVPLKLEQQTDGYGYHLRCANYYISTTPKNGFKLHPAFYGENGNPVDYILLSAYEGSIYDTSSGSYLANDEQIADFSADKLSSISGVKPCSGNTQNLTRANAELLAKNRGNGWHIDTIKTISLNQLLMAVEYGSFNMQSAIGLGVSFVTDDGTGNHAIATGDTSYLGNSTGTTDNTSPIASVSYRGMENIWGNIWAFANGLNIYGNGTLKGGVPYVCTDFNFTEYKKTDNYESVGFTSANSGGYISSFGYSVEKYDWLFIVSEALGNSDFPIGDTVAVFPNFDGFGTAVFGGYCSNGYVNGPFYSVLGWGASSSLRFIGARLIYMPVSSDV